MGEKKIVKDPSTTLRTNSRKGIRIAVGMSGGVDSSVSACLLKKQGYDVVGLFMKLWHDPCGTGQNACCDAKALADARKVARTIGIPFYVVDVRKEFKKAVADYFIEEYKNLGTPNPCIVCNKKIKFGWLLDFAKKIGCDYLATGHYSRVVDDSGISNFQFPISNQFQNPNDKFLKIKNYHLLKGVDGQKDQSYFLYQLNQEQLSKTIFPVGGMTKDQVRKIAKGAGLPVYQKKESQEICFVEDDYRDFLRRNLGDTAFKPGEIADRTGKIVGHHNGLINYTIGQRKGIEQSTLACHPEPCLPVGRSIQDPEVLSDIDSGSRATVRNDRVPLYVTGFNLKKNQLIVGKDEDLYKSEFEVEDMHWTNPNTELRIMNNELDNIKVRIRYKADEISCSISLIHHSLFLIQVKKPVRAITPGQSAVFYDGDEILGGGIIR